MEGNWHARMGRFLGGYPRDYVAFDTETTGVNPTADSTFPVQIGFATYFDGARVGWSELLVDWSKGENPVDRAWFYGLIGEVRDRMASFGKPYHVTWEMVADSGVAPAEAIETTREILAGDLPIVAHNGYAYDGRLLAACSRRLGTPFDIPVESLIDTGMIEKAFRLGWDPPAPGEHSREDWYRRVSGRFAKGVKWSLDGACEARYGLSARHGFGTGAAHSAGFDSVACATLLEVYRDLAEGRSPAAVPE